MNDEDIEVQCPWCGAWTAAPAGAAGAEVKCLHCNGVFRPTADEREIGDGEPESVPADAVAAMPGPRMVCRMREGTVNPLAAGAVIATFTGMNERAARMEANRGMGIMAGGLAPDTAENMCRALAEEGIEAFAVPEAAMPRLGPKLNVEHVDHAGAQGLLVRVHARSEAGRISWDRLAAGLCTWTPQDRLYKTESYRDSIVTARGAQIPIRRSRRTLGEPRMCVTLFFRGSEGAARQMGLHEREFDYSFLGERMGQSADLNCMAFLERTTEWAPAAFFPEGYYAAAENDSARFVRPVSKVARQNYVRWTLCCAAARGVFLRG